MGGGRRCWSVRPPCFRGQPSRLFTSFKENEETEVKAQRHFPIVLTWWLGSSFFLLSVLSVPCVVWQDVLLLLWLETPSHKCSQNPEPSVKLPLLTDNESQFLSKSPNSVRVTPYIFPQASFLAAVRWILFPIHSKQWQSKDFFGGWGVEWRETEKQRCYLPGRGMWKIEGINPEQQSNKSSPSSWGSGH